MSISERLLRKEKAFQEEVDRCRKTTDVADPEGQNESRARWALEALAEFNVQTRI